jgi:acylphosphatase
MTSGGDDARSAERRREPFVRHVIIKGRVQGVGFRYWVEQEALLRGLEGFVRNRRDGSVEALFSGSATIVAEMLQACLDGPPGAQVSAIEDGGGGVELVAQRRRGERFSVLPTT